MNADEAQKCLTIAKRAINERDFAKAERFLIKSIKLHETNEAQTLLQRLDHIKASAASQNSTKSSRAASPPLQRKSSIPEPPPPKPYTAEEAKIAKDVLRCKDYYTILGVTKNADDKELKKAYRKKCLKVHPDKNNSPDADEAFKKINAAMACLSDPVKRRQYNQLGNTDAFEQKESRGGAPPPSQFRGRGQFRGF